MYHSIRQGKEWLDTNGNRIQAHGGSVMYVDGVYYWYGENKEKTTGDSHIWHWGYAATPRQICTTGKTVGLLFLPNRTIQSHPCIQMQKWIDHTSFITDREICLLAENHE